MLTRIFKILVLFFLICSSAQANSIQLGGTNGMVTFPYNTAWDNLPLEIYKHFRLDVLPITRGEKATLFILERNSGADYIWKLYVSDSDNKIHFTTNSGTGVDIESNSAIEAGKIYSVQISIDANREVRMYLDDQVRAPTTIASQLLQFDVATTAALVTTNPGNLIAGCKSDGTECMDGTLFETIGWNADPATFQTISLFDMLKVETNIINHWPYFDGVGNVVWSRYQYPNVGYDNGVASGDFSWNIDKSNFIIEQEYNKYYYPGTLSDANAHNSGIYREVEPYASNDYSWNDMRLVTECKATGNEVVPLPDWYYKKETCENKCDTNYYIDAVNGNDTAPGDGSLAHPWKTLQKALEPYVNRPKYRECYYLHTGTYNGSTGYWYSDATLGPSATVKGSENNRVWLGAMGDGPVRLKIDHTRQLNWSTFSGNIKKTNYQIDAEDDFQVSNVVLDDNFPNCCEKMYSTAALTKDGDWFVDEKESIATGTATNKIIDSTANFGNENPPTRVGMKVIAVKQYGRVSTITNIDSPTQLTIDTGGTWSSSSDTTSGDKYRIYGDLYVYLATGSNPYTDRNAVVTGKAENIEYGLSLTQAGHMTVFGIEIIGAQSYAINSFGVASADDMDYVRVYTKYNKGFDFGGKNTNIIQSRSHGDVNSRVGNGIYYAVGSQGGWPSSMNNGDNSYMWGNVISWGGGECTGGQFADNRVSQWNIASTCWSVIHYGVDSSRNFTFNNNVGIQHVFQPHYVDKKSDNEIGRCWQRMMADGMLSGDEEGPYSQHHEYHHNLFLGTKTFIGQFSSCGVVGGVTKCGQSGFYPFDVPSGWKYNTIANNVWIGPWWPGRAAAFEWVGNYVQHQSGPTHDQSVGSMWVNNFFYFPMGGYHFWWYSDTLDPEPNVHLVDNNYHLSKYPHAFQWRGAKMSFADFQSNSNAYDVHGIFQQPNANGTIPVTLFNRTDWNLEGEEFFKWSDFYPAPGSVLIDAGHTFDVTGTWAGNDFQFDPNGNRMPIGKPTDIGVFSTDIWFKKDIHGGTIKGGSF